MNSEETKALFQKVVPGIQEGVLVEILEPENLEGTVVVLGHHLLGVRGGDVITSERDVLSDEDSSKKEKSGEDS